MKTDHVSIALGVLGALVVSIQILAFLAFLAPSLFAPVLLFLGFPGVVTATP